MKPTIKHLGKTLSKAQIDALLFALTEGEVGPGSKGLLGARITRSTIRYLQGAGLATATGMVTYSIVRKAQVWVTLTAWGREVAHKAFKETRGYAWVEDPCKKEQQS